MMRLLREVDSAESDLKPAIPDGWNVGTLGNHGILLACDGFSIKFDIDQLNRFFDFIEDGKVGDIRDHDGNVVNVNPVNDGVILTRKNDAIFPNGVFVDLPALKHLGVELNTEVVGQNPSVEPDYSAETEAYPEQTYPEDGEQGADNNVTIKDTKKEVTEKLKGDDESGEHDHKIKPRTKKKFKVTSVFRTERKPESVKKTIVRILRSKKLVQKERHN